MQLIHAAAASLNQTPLDWNLNKKNILRSISMAKKRGASILCLPELCITGYGCEDAFQAPGLLHTAEKILQSITPHTRGIIVAIGLPRMYRGGLYNTCCLLADGHILGFAAKQNLAGAGVHYEPRWFKAWPSGVAGETELAGQTYPIGDLLFDCGGINIGFEICEDAWTAKRPGRELSQAGAGLLLNPSASHFAFGKQEIRRRLVLEGSRAFGVGYLYANLIGNEAGRVIYDGGALIANDGKILAEGDRFSFEDVQITSAHIDLESNRKPETQIQKINPKDIRTADRVIQFNFEFPKLEPANNDRDLVAWEKSPNIKEEEFTRAVALGLFDYLRKSRSAGYVVSLSGGCDSSSVATLVAMAVQLGIAELGQEGFVQKLSHIGCLSLEDNSSALIRKLLTCVYQATNNSSKTTRDAAYNLSTSLNATFFEWNIDSFVEGYSKCVEHAVERKLTWAEDDLTLQNIQARARAPGVWMLANLKRSLLLSTSNRSEAAVGYATMDGDTSGGLAPIAGIDKAFLRCWLLWMEQTGPEGLSPIPALKEINQQQPTAELRPHSDGQTDESDLMPYDLLDAVERSAIRDKHMPLEVYQLIKIEFPQYAHHQIEKWVMRFFRLWSRNQWKRERYAPSFHLDDENLDPKTWCRFPILSGGFERELDELHTWIAANEPIIESQEKK